MLNEVDGWYFYVVFFAVNWVAHSDRGVGHVSTQSSLGDTF